MPIVQQSVNMSSKLATAYILHEDAWYLRPSVESFRAAGSAFAFVSRVPWHDEPGDWEGADLVLGEWRSELEHLTWLAAHGVAEAAFNLGVTSARHGALKEALEWTERAVALDPGAPAARQQALQLAAALAAQPSPDSVSAALTFEEALARVAADLNPNSIRFEN